MNRPHPSQPALRVVIGRRVAAVSAVFILFLALLMGAHVYLLRTVDPLDSPAIAALIERLDAEPGDELLRRQVRELDLLARRAFFVRQWQLETGAWLLAVGAAVFLVGLQLMRAGRKALPDLRSCPAGEDPWAAACRARRLLAGVGLLLLVTGLSVFWAGLRRASIRVPGEAAEAPSPGEFEVFAGDGEAAAPATPGWPAESDRYWPSFRGVGGLGVASHADPPIAWDGETGEGVRWKSRIPRSGYSSPVVWGDRVFLTGGDTERREVYAFDAETGELLWTADTVGVPGAPDALPEVTDDTGYAAPSVATDGQRVVAVFATGVVLALDFDGRRLWARRLPMPDNPYGHASSLLIYGGAVLVQYDHFGGPEVMALDLETGRPRWERMREAEISWASPILVESNGRMQLVLSAAPMVAAYDARTGEELWSTECMNGEIGPSPAYAAGRVFAANPYARAVALDAGTGEMLWQSNRLELPDVGSPLATAEHLFVPTSYGVFSCVDAATGEVLWEHEFDSGGYGSPILARDRLYWVTEEGVTRIFSAAPEFALLGEAALGEASYATPAAVGRRLYIRGEEHLFCVGSE